MERTPSKERVIPIEIIGHVSDVSEDEIDIENFVENINSKINISMPPKCDKPQVENENSSSNRGSLIITHEDGTIEENECTVTCLGISSDSGSNQGLQIEEISQDTLKDKLAEDKLKVVIPDKTPVIIVEADEVTDPSFMSTFEVEESSQADEISMYDDIIMYDIDYKKEESSTPHSTTQATTYKMRQEENKDTIQHQKEGNPKQQDLVEAVGFLNLSCNTQQGDNFDTDQVQKFAGEEETGSIELLEDVKTINIEQQIKEIQGQCENPSEEGGQQLTKNNRKSSIGDCKSVKSKENESTSVANLQTVQSKDIEILEVQINLDDEVSPEYKDTNNVSKQNSKENDRSEETRRFVEPINKDDLNLKISVDEAEDQDKFPQKTVIAETVRIIPITPPDGRFLEREILSDHCVNQMEYNNSKLPDIEHDVKDLTNRDHAINDRNNKARTITIQIEAPENPSTLKQESEKDAKDEKTIEEKEEGQHNANSDNHMESFNFIAKSSQSTDKLSETMSMKSSTQQFNQRVESKDISKISSNKMIGNFNNKEQEPTRITTQLPAEELFLEDNQEQSKNEIATTSIKIDIEKERTNLKEKPDASNSVDDLENKRINTLNDDCDKTKQTEETQQENTCSDDLSRQLNQTNVVENERERNVPIVQPVSEGEKIYENEKTNFELINNCIDSKRETDIHIERSILTDSFSNQMTKVFPDEISATSTGSFYGRRVSIQQTDSSPCNSTDEQLNNQIRNPKHSAMEDWENTDYNKQTEATPEDNTCPSTLYRQSSEKKGEKIISRNIPIQVQRNIDDESKNIHQIESREKDIAKDENMKKECSASIEKKDQIKADSSLEAKNQTDGNPTTQNPIGPASSIYSSVVRTVPIQIIGCTAAESEDLDKNLKIETKSNDYEQTQTNIPIQKDVSGSFQATKAYDLIVEENATGKPMIESKTHPTTERQTLPENRQQGTKSVLIKIQIPDETVEIQSAKELNTEMEAKEKQCKISQEIHTSTILNRTSAESEPEKYMYSYPSKFRPPPVPTSKPPPVVRTIPILRQSLSDSGEGMTRQQTGARQRNKSEQSTRGDILQKVHQDLEEARAKLTAQANSLSSGLENMPKPVANKNDPRSRSVESEQRYQGAKPKDVKPRNLFKRERSLHDIDKDIETIWKELQELDKPDMENEISTQRRNRNSTCAQTPFSEQVLVTPSWRTPTPPPPSQSVRTSISNPNISNVATQNQPPLPQTTYPHTIWDTQNKQGATSEATNSGQLSSSWDFKPQYIPTKSSKHFGFTPKAETKPGVITPSYVSQSPKSAHTQLRNIPIEKSEVPLHNGKELKKETIRTQQAQESLKSCLKSEASTQSIRNRSQSPSNVKYFNKHKSGEKAPKTSGRNSEPDPPFEWVDFRKADGEIVKGTILPPLHRENDVIISRDVPIINVLLDDALKEETNPKEKNKTPTMKEKEPKSPTKPDSKYQKDNPSSETFNACDAGTQTEKFEKKGGCQIM